MSPLLENTTEATDISRKRVRWALQSLSPRGTWSGFVLTQPYPVPPDRAAYRRVFQLLLELMPETQTPFEPEAFLQMDRLDFRKETPLVQQHSDILGDYGLGIYPELPPPATWTREEFMDRMYPEKLRPLAYDIMQVDGGPEAIETIRPLFLGSGAYTELYCAAGTRFYKNASALFRPAITDQILRTFPYHAPLLTRRSVEAATPEQLDAWTCGAALYLRESLEDNGLLVLRKGDVQPLLRNLVEDQSWPEAEFLVG